MFDSRSPPYLEKSMKKILIAAAVSVISVTAVQAADLAARPAYTKALAPSPAYDWTGFYLGGEVGGQWSTTDLARVGPTPGTLAYSIKNDSVAAGGFAGVQGQFGQFVLGVEGGYITGFNSTTIATPSTNIFAPGGTGTATVKGARDVWTGGARLGYAFNTWLPYVTGGYANGRFGFDAITTGGTFPENASARLDGYYIGAGLDYALAPNWIIGGEYRHYQFQSKTVAAISPLAGETVNIGGKGDTFVGRLSYKFNWSAPLVARY
jgi:outer membrane immunogenic protein